MDNRRDPLNPHGDQRRLNPTQRAVASTTRKGLLALDRINSRAAVDIADTVRNIGNRPINDADHDNIMADVDRILATVFGPSPKHVLESPVGKLILDHCLEAGQKVHEAEENKIVTRQMRAVRKDPALARAIVRRHGMAPTNS